MGKQGKQPKQTGKRTKSLAVVKEPKSTKKPVKAATSKPSGKDPNQPKKPATAFFIFLEEFRKSYKKDHPDSKGVAAVGKAGGDKWKGMTDEEKAPFAAKAAKRKADYDKDLKAYNKKKKGGKNTDDEEDEDEDGSGGESEDKPKPAADDEEEEEGTEDEDD